MIARISKSFDVLPAELRKAAYYVVGNPSEVAFRSMRSVATSAGVSPATMLRLARAVGAQSFLARAQEIRSSHAKTKWVGRVHRLIDEELASIQSCV